MGGIDDRGDGGGVPAGDGCVGDLEVVASVEHLAIDLVQRCRVDDRRRRIGHGERLGVGEVEVPVDVGERAGDVVERVDASGQRTGEAVAVGVGRPDPLGHGQRDLDAGGVAQQDLAAVDRVVVDPRAARRPEGDLDVAKGVELAAADGAAHARVGEVAGGPADLERAGERPVGVERIGPRACGEGHRDGAGGERAREVEAEDVADLLDAGQRDSGRGGAEQRELGAAVEDRLVVQRPSPRRQEAHVEEATSVERRRCRCPHHRRGRSTPRWRRRWRTSPSTPRSGSQGPPCRSPASCPAVPYESAANVSSASPSGNW